MKLSYILSENRPSYEPYLLYILTKQQRIPPLHAPFSFVKPLSSIFITVNDREFDGDSQTDLERSQKGIISSVRLPVRYLIYCT